MCLWPETHAESLRQYRIWLKEKYMVYVMKTEKQSLKLDVRTKLLSVLVISQIMITSNTSEQIAILKVAAVCLAILIILLSGQYLSAIKFAFVYLAIYFLSTHLEFKSPMAAMFSVVMTGFFLQFMPGAYLLGNTLNTTSVREFIAAMKKMHLTSTIVIPISIMFRFIPAINEEYRNIKKAMYMRNITCEFNPIKFIEYRLIPLLMSILNIGNELTIVAVARGFGREGKKTSTCVVKLTMLDYLFIVILFALGITGMVVAIRS